MIRLLHRALPEDRPQGPGSQEEEVLWQWTEAEAGVGGGAAAGGPECHIICKLLFSADGQIKPKNLKKDPNPLC